MAAVGTLDLEPANWAARDLINRYTGDNDGD